MSIKYLYILDDFPPVGMQSGIRALNFSKYLLKDNIYPIILTKRIERDRIFNLKLANEIPKDLIIYRTNMLKLRRKIFHLFDKIFRIENYIKWLPYAYFFAKKIIKSNKNIKFIYATGPHFHTHIIGYFLKKKLSIPLILEYRDPWSFNPYSDPSKYSLNQKFDLYLEQKILRSADMIVTVSDPLIEYLKSYFSFISSKPIISIPNGLEITSHQINKEKWCSDIVLTFTGSLYEKRTIVPLFNIISKLKKDNFFNTFKLIIKCFGYYDDRSKLERIIKRLNIENIVKLHGFITRTEALDEINKADLAIHVGENLNYPTIAFKVWDYLALRKKILYLGLENSYTAEFIRDNNFGVVIPINNLKKGKNILKNLLINMRDKRYNNYIEEEKITTHTWKVRSKSLRDQIIYRIVKK